MFRRCLPVLLGMAASWPWVLSGQSVLKPEDNRLTRRADFYGQPTGTLAYVPQAKSPEEVRFAALFDPLPESGRYLIAKQTTYCFAFNHRDAAQEGTRSYVGIGSLSVLVGRTDPLRPVALFRNDGWERAGDPGFE